MKKYFLLAAALLCCCGFLQAQSLKVEVENGKFQSDNASLQQYECPEWFRDAKFGIWSHWGPQSVPMIGHWYGRNMYVEGSRAYKHHVEHYGHPSTFGYKDIVQLWKAEKFDPEYLMDLFVKAGAKYFCTIGAHHDGFDLWDSKHNRWNAVNMGPKRDIVREWEKASRKHGLRFGVSEHFARAYNWMATSHGSDKEGPMAGVPYDGNDPANFDFYFPPKIDDTGSAYPVNPPTWWQEQWYNRMQDIIQNYQPDLLYSDGAFPMGNTGKQLIADFYNQNMSWNNGKLEAVYTQKNLKTKKHGEYIPGAGIHDLEQGIVPTIQKEPWQIDTSISSWSYDKDFKNKENRTMYYSPAHIIRLLIDVVSKNGNMMLNILQHPNGSIDPEAKQILDDLAMFIQFNGEGIYATRPWRVCSEGSTMGNTPYSISKAKYAKDEVHFTTSKGGEYLYAFGLHWPENSIATIKSLNAEAGKIKSVSLLGSKEKVSWKQTDKGLIVELPQNAKPSKHVYAIKIKGEGLIE